MVHNGVRTRYEVVHVSTQISGISHRYLMHYFSWSEYHRLAVLLQRALWSRALEDDECQEFGSGKRLPRSTAHMQETNSYESLVGRDKGGRVRTENMQVFA